MKYVASLTLGLSTGLLLAVACVDDERPVAAIPTYAGEGGEPGSTGGSASGGSASQAGDANEGGSAGAPSGAAGQPEMGGAGPSAAGAAGADTGGQAGETAEGAPFAGPYGVIYAAPALGVDTRFPELTTWHQGELESWISNLDQGHEHAIGTAQNLDTGSDGGVVQWGRWADGTLGGDDSDIVLNDKQGFHYAIGALTPVLPASGSASYELVGQTPVTVGDGSAAVMTGLVAAEATAAFGATTKVGVTINLTVGGVTYVVVTTGTYATPSTSELETWDAEQPARLGGIPLEPSQGICADGCSRSLQGFFAGADASHLALVVHLFDGAGGNATSVSSVIVMKKMSTPEPRAELLSDSGDFPNSRYPALIYARVVTSGDLAAHFEALFEENGWPGAWRNGLYRQHHYHSTAHEVLGVYRGHVSLRLGGPAGPLVTLQAGDVAIIPAGVAHKNEAQSSDFAVVGAYPTGTGPDMQYGKPGERPTTDRTIAALAKPTRNPVTGLHGALLRLWG